jgi:hypothetical protein
MTISSCNDTASTASLSLLLPSQDISLQIQLTGLDTIGGFRISLEGPGMYIENDTLNAAYTLVDLAFAQMLYIAGHLLTPQPSCTLQITKLINRTYPLSKAGKTEFSALWLPFFSGTLDEMFVDETEYKYATSSSTVLSIVISETSYYILNTQRPIAAEGEVIFTNILFTIMCLEIFGLAFLIFKLIVIPVTKRVFNWCRQRASMNNSYKTNHDLPEIYTTRM